MSDIYVVTDRGRVVGASTRLQGAELLKIEEATREAGKVYGRMAVPDAERQRYIEQRAAVMVTTNVELRDDDE